MLLSYWLLACTRVQNCFIFFNCSVQNIFLNVDVALRFSKIIFIVWVTQVFVNQSQLSWLYRWAPKRGGMRAQAPRAACGWSEMRRNLGLHVARPRLWLPHSYYNLCFVSFSMYVLAPITHQILRKLIATTRMSLENIVPRERSQHKDHILWLHLNEMSRTGHSKENKD